MYDIIVIGGGPAGLTAALYAVRAGKSVMVLEQNSFGGQIATSPRVENYPSIAEISGAQLANDMFEQAVSHGVEFDMGCATVATNGQLFDVATEYNNYQSKAVILATGVSHKHLGIDSEQQFAGKGICYCAVCDGAFFRDKEVCVVGDGNSAAQYALYLQDICSSVTLLTLFDKLFCDKELTTRIVNSDKIQWIQNVSVTEFVGEEQLTAVVYKDSDGAITYHDTDGVFIAIGQQPHNQPFEHLVQLDDKGFIVAGDDCKTSCPGIFVAGDCRTKLVRQCTTAVGDGATAAFVACQYVDKLN